MKPMKSMNQPRVQEQDDGGSDGDDMHDTKDGQQSPPPSSGKRNARNSSMGTEEWSRQRKDNHKEVERRRRGNINEGINELGRIVPNGSGEKAKGAILSRAVQYIHHLKDNEARNIEKWTLEKLLMDQAMGDLQAQLEEMRRAWDEERVARQKAQNELEAFKSGRGDGKTSHVRSRSPKTKTKTKGEERDEEDEEEEEEEEEEEDVEMSDTRGGKRQRVE
jgi:bHLH factor